MALLMHIMARGKIVCLAAGPPELGSWRTITRRGHSFTHKFMIATCVKGPRISVGRRRSALQSNIATTLAYLKLGTFANAALMEG